MDAKLKPKPTAKRKPKPTRAASDLAALTATVAAMHEKVDAVILAMSTRIAEINEKVDLLLLAFHAAPQERNEEDGDPASNGTGRRPRRASLLD